MKSKALTFILFLSWTIIYVRAGNIQHPGSGINATESIDETDASSVDETASSSVDDEILYSQEVLIGRLYAALGQLRSENAALRDKIGLLESSSASVGGAISASNAALKTEVFRLVRKTQEKRDNHRSGQEEEGGGSSDEEGKNINNNGIGQWTRPQQVNVVCKDAAAISVVPLTEEDRGNDECLILQFKAPDLDSRFVMYCDSVT